MSEITTTYSPGFSKDAQDAVFYAGNFDCVVCVSNGKRGFHVRVCGDTKAQVWSSVEAAETGKDDDYKTVRSGDEWEYVGILTDEDLSAAEDRITWDNNSWYEIFADNTEDEDVFDGEVYHTVEDAVAAITEELEVEVSEQQD